MALLTTILVALSPLLADPPAKPPEPVVSSPTPGGAASQAGARALPALNPAPPGGPSPESLFYSDEAGQIRPESGSQRQPGSAVPPHQAVPGSGLASWYGQRPATCDGVAVPWWVKQWTASLTLPCGSLVTLSGPAGTVTVPVEDRGPEAWTGRMFDLTPGAFAAVAGSLAPGVVPVEWSPVP